MSRVKLKAGIVLIFLLGCLAGGLAVEYHHQGDGKDHPRRPHTQSERVDFVIKRLARDLDLSEQQIRQIRPFVEQGERSISKLREGIEPQIKQHIDQVLAAIREKIDAGQKDKLDQLVKKLKSFSRKADEAKESGGNK